MCKSKMREMKTSNSQEDKLSQSLKTNKGDLNIDPSHMTEKNINETIINHELSENNDNQQDQDKYEWQTARSKRSQYRYQKARN